MKISLKRWFSDVNCNQPHSFGIKSIAVDAGHENSNYGEYLLPNAGRTNCYMYTCCIHAGNKTIYDSCLRKLIKNLKIYLRQCPSWVWNYTVRFVNPNVFGYERAYMYVAYCVKQCRGTWTETSWQIYTNFKPHLLSLNLIYCNDLMNHACWTYWISIFFFLNLLS